MQKKEVKKKNNSKIKAVFFDLDGVLIDSYKAWFNVVNNTLQHYQLKAFLEKEFKKGFGNPIDKDAKTIYKGKNIEEIKEIYARFFKNQWKAIKIFKDTVPVLKELKKRKLKIALISNSPRKVVNVVMSRLKLKKYFDFIATMDDVLKGKPAPDSLLLGLKKLNLKREQVLFVGDTHNDIIAGKRAKITTIGYGIKADYEIKRLNSVLIIIN